VAHGPLGQRLKRAIDVVGALTGLVLTAPVLGACAVAITVQDRGPVLFAQTRIGQGGWPFTMYKLRSMVRDAEALKPTLQARNEADEPAFKMMQDPRVTRLGAWLRRTSLDELPQLWCVLRGDMSLVGPRPATPDEVARWSPEARRRLAVKPGLTGIWQVSGRSELDGRTWLAMDLDYVERASIGLDLWLILKTVPAVLSGRGAW